MEAIGRIRKLNKNVILNLTVVTTREFRFRAWLAMRLIGLAAWILDCRLEVEMKSRTSVRKSG